MLQSLLLYLLDWGENMNSYLSVGTRCIKSELFKSVCDSSFNDNIKPSGGFWMTEFDVRFPDYNIWVDYILTYPHILFYKSRSNDPFVQPCSVVYLKEDANIYHLCSKDDYNFLIKSYSNGMGRFSFEKLSLDYDGIYINLFNLRNSLSSEEFNLFLSFSVNTMLLFNLDCIDYYHAGVLDIEEFDYCDIYSSSFINYNIKFDNDKRYVDDNEKGKVKVLKK